MLHTQSVNARFGWALGNPEDEQVVETLRSRIQCGFPCGDEAFIFRLSEMLGRRLVLPRSR